MAKSRQISMIETVTKSGLGYALAVAAQIVVFPRFGLHPSLGQSLALCGIFTAISLVLGYILRRLFEASGARNSFASPADGCRGMAPPPDAAEFLRERARVGASTKIPRLNPRMADRNVARVAPVQPIP